jgi:hypothetical protein
MSKLKITRKSSMIYSVRDIKVFIDGQLIGTLSDGETREFTIPEGDHNLQAKFDWRGSKMIPVALSVNDTKNLTFSVSRYESYLLFATGAFMLLHYFLIYKFAISFIFWFAIPTLSGLIYLMTFGRNFYIKIVG